jgi:hypothetical protein
VDHIYQITLVYINYIHTHTVHIHIHTYTHTNIHTLTHTYTHTHTHTHITCMHTYCWGFSLDSSQGIMYTIYLLNWFLHVILQDLPVFFISFTLHFWILSQKIFESLSISNIMWVWKIRPTKTDQFAVCALKGDMPIRSNN